MFVGLSVAVVVLAGYGAIAFIQRNLFAILVIFVMFVAFTATLIYEIVCETKKSKFKRLGKKQLVRFVGLEEGRNSSINLNDRVVNLKQYYCVKFRYRGDDGKILEGRVDNIELFDAERLKKANYFEVYLVGNEAMVINYPSEEDIEKYSKIKNYKNCSYCGSKTEVDEKQCSKCGSTQFEEIF